MARFMVKFAGPKNKKDEGDLLSDATIDAPTEEEAEQVARDFLSTIVPIDKYRHLSTEPL